MPHLHSEVPTPPAEDWTTPEAVRLLNWFAGWEPPARPIYVPLYLLVIDLREDIALGPQGPHIHQGSVLAKLRDLHARWAPSQAA